MPEQLDYASISEIFRRFHAAEPEPKGELEHVSAFTLLVAVALSAQATDRGVNRATEGLFKVADTPEKMLELGETGLIAHIKTIGLFNSKARHIMKLSRILVDDYGGEVPSSRAALQSLPGVGRKTANVVLNTWFRLPAMAVDTHIFRVSNRTGIAPGRDVVAVERGAGGSGAGRLPASRAPLADPARTLRLPGAQAALPHLHHPRSLCLRGEEPVTKRYQVVGIGNALVDVIAHVADDFLAENGVEKGIMQLIDTARAVELYGRMGPAREISGGSAANTVAGLAALGARTAYVGKVKDDQLGAIFAHDLRAQGADYATPLAPKYHAHETGRCMVLVSPDGERSMSTYLGVSEFLAPSDIDEAEMAAAESIFLEGYRFDGPDSIAAFGKAVRAAKGAGGKVGITLSDPFCVERHRDEFLRMIRSDVDLLVANEHELQSLYLTDDLATAMDRAEAEVPLTACTVGAEGAHILGGGARVHAPATKVKVVDATGAGDLFAAGFLHGLTTGRDRLTAARMGCVAAGEVISHVGARPEADLRALFAAESLL